MEFSVPASVENLELSVPTHLVLTFCIENPCSRIRMPHNRASHCSNRYNQNLENHPFSTKTVKTHFYEIFLEVKEVKEVNEVKSRYPLDAVCFQLPTLQQDYWPLTSPSEHSELTSLTSLTSATQIHKIFLGFSSRKLPHAVLSSAAARKLVESSLSRSSCATEQVLSNNKLSRSVFDVFVFRKKFFSSKTWHKLIF